MTKKITILMVLALTICSFTYFGHNNDAPKVYDRVTIQNQANTGFENTSNPNPKFYNAPMNFEGPKSVGDVLIGPEVPITGLTGFYDYHFNGNQDHYIYRSGPGILHAVYMLSLDSASVSPSRRVKYAFSSDNGSTWTDLGTVPSIRAGLR
jgi:hypothetical protein